MHKQYLLYGVGAVAIGAIAAFASNPGSALPFSARAGDETGLSGQSADIVKRCDKLGAHPSDPLKEASGVKDANLKADAVIEACRAALEVDPEPARLGYQLARGLVQTGEIEEGLEYLIASAEAGHGGAMSLLGDIFLYGTDGVEADPETAIAYYEQAALANFKPAAKMLKSFEEEAEKLARAEEKEAKRAAEEAKRNPIPDQLDFEAFQAPNVMQAIYTGQFENASLPTYGGAGYAYHMAEMFRTMCPGTFKKAEVDAYKESVMRSAVNQAFDPDFQIKMLEQMALGYAELVENPAEAMIAASGIGDDLPPNEQIEFAAGGDAMLFGQMYGCDSPAGGRFIENLRKKITE
jgi:TPR repeat protein